MVKVATHMPNARFSRYNSLKTAVDSLKKEQSNQIDQARKKVFVGNYSDRKSLKRKVEHFYENRRSIKNRYSLRNVGLKNIDEKM